MYFRLPPNLHPTLTLLKNLHIAGAVPKIFRDYPCHFYTLFLFLFIQYLLHSKISFQSLFLPPLVFSPGMQFRASGVLARICHPCHYLLFSFIYSFIHFYFVFYPFTQPFVSFSRIADPRERWGHASGVTRGDV